MKRNLSTGELTNEMIGCNLIVSFVNWMYHTCETLLTRGIKRTLVANYCTDRLISTGRYQALIIIRQNDDR